MRIRGSAKGKALPAVPSPRQRQQDHRRGKRRNRDAERRSVSTAQKELTAEYAKDIENVKEVKNEMTVAAAPESEPANELTREKIDDAPSRPGQNGAVEHRSTSALKTKVMTQDARYVDRPRKSAAEKALVTKLVDDIHVCDGVKNEMTVEEGKPGNLADCCRGTQRIAGSKADSRSRHSIFSWRKYVAASRKEQPSPRARTARPFRMALSAFGYFRIGG